MECQICGKESKDVCERECAYDREFYNTANMEVICDACEEQHALDF